MSSASRNQRVGAPGVARTKPLLVTGGAGFLGCNLADRLATAGEHVVVLDALSRSGVEGNLAWLRRRHPRRISSVIADVRDPAAADAVTEVACVFHLAAQVAVTTSLQDPTGDLDVNIGGTLNLLEATRRCPQPPPFIFASTNKVYGELADLELALTKDGYRPQDPDVAVHGISEQQPLCFHTPYGCSKGAADQYVLDYARTFGLPATVMRMSCIYGPHQCGTEDQGWVAHFIISALQRRPITIYGDGHQVRDVLYVDDAVNAYVRAFRNIGAVKGRAFNLGGGPSHAISLRQLIARIGELLGCAPEMRFAGWRPGDQRYYVSDTRRVANALALPHPRPWEAGVALLVDWLAKSRSEKKLPVSSHELLPARA